MKKHVLECAVTAPSLAADESIIGTFLFPGEFLGFQGHFPGAPVLPAVVQMMTAQVSIEQVMGTALRLKSAVNAKFLDKIGANESVQISCVDKGAGRYVCTLCRQCDSAKVATFILQF